MGGALMGEIHNGWNPPMGESLMGERKPRANFQQIWTPFYKILAKTLIQQQKSSLIVIKN